MIVIDGGFSLAYQKVTGIAGYTLVSDSRVIKLIAHEPFVSTEEAVRSERDMHSTAEIIRRAGGASAWGIPTAAGKCGRELSI